MARAGLAAFAEFDAAKVGPALLRPYHSLWSGGMRRLLTRDALGERRVVKKREVERLEILRVKRCAKAETGGKNKLLKRA
jgi:hypothetical protein